jgi:hypothetical protein
MTRVTESVAGWAGPYIEVGGAPFPIVGAEVHNSSSSTVVAIAESFATVHLLGANTVLAPVAWDRLEPVEGSFDFTLIDAMVATARSLGLRLIPLWFGSWKNAASTYVPAWVKTNLDRFPRTVLADGRRIEHLTPFSAESRAADARAFAALMCHIRDIDAAGTVIAVQVENEVGLLGDTRDRSALADAAFAALVPAAVVEAVAGDVGMPLHAAWADAGAVRHGTWGEVFPAGDRTDEAFMAAAFAAYVGEVAAVGAAQHQVPLFVNAWLDADSVLDGPVAVAGGKRPGDYPSGGPVMPVAAIWEALAPALDVLAVDLYVDDAEPAFRAYGSRRGRLFVPELRADTRGIAQMFSAMGTHRALGVSPFGVDSLDPEDKESALLRDAYRLLGAAAELIRRRPDARVHGFALDGMAPSTELVIGDVVVTVHTAGDHAPIVTGYPAYGIAIEDGSDAVYLLGRGFWITFSSATGQSVSLVSATAYDFDEGMFTVSRELNGDETANGTLIPFPLAGSPLLSSRVIPTRVPDTGIVRLRPYVF